MPSIKQWQVWWIDQTASRSGTEPFPQPGDPSSKARMYVVVAEPNGRRAITCCPIGGVGSAIGITDVELPARYRGTMTNKPSKISCHEIYTFPNQYFLKMAGTLDVAKQQEVQDALVNFLDLC